MLETTFNNQLDSSIRHQLAKHYYNEVFQSQPTDNYPLRVKDEEVLVAQKKLLEMKKQLLFTLQTHYHSQNFLQFIKMDGLRLAFFLKKKKI